MFEKEASKWREMVRNGRLSSVALGELKEMGLHGTKASAKKELAGISRGNTALLKKLDIATRPGFEWRTVTSNGLLDMLDSRRTTNKKLIVYPSLPNDLRTATMMLKTTKPVAMRHEIDELRALQKLRNAMSRKLKRAPTNNELQSARHLVAVIGGHQHPSVLIRESGHVNMVGGATREHFMEYRRITGEDRHLRRSLGVGYGKLDEKLLRTRAGRKRLQGVQDDRTTVDAKLGRDDAFVSAMRRLYKRITG
jgi:hypothetical protein